MFAVLFATIPALGEQTVSVRQSETANTLSDPSEPQTKVIEGFEGVEPTWTLEESDDLVGVLAHRRVDVEPYAGRRSEYLSVVGRRGGERILVTHPIPPSAAIKEFQASVWVNGNREGYQLSARVRFPRALAENDEPRSAMILGDRYSAEGIWQQLSLRDVYARSQSAARELRIRLRAPVDTAEAYIDQVSINIYGGAARNQIQIDELALTAAIPVSRTSRNVPSSDTFANAAALNVDGLATDGLAQQFELNDLAFQRIAPSQMAMIRPFGKNSRQNFVARAITYHGESFEFLKEIGFNTIWLEQPPTMAQLKRAYELGIYLLAPPRFEPAVGRPANSPLAVTQTAYDDRILAWTWIPIASAASNAALVNEQAAIANRIRLIKSRDPRKRPFVFRPVSTRTAIPHGVDVLVDPIAGARNARSAAAQRRRDRRSRWAAIGAPLVNSSRWRPLRDQIWDGVFNGYDGFLLLTTKNLEAPESLHARNLAELFNLELSMMRPWIQPDSVDRDFIPSKHFAVRHLAANQSDLILVSQTTPQRGRRRFVPSTANEILIPTAKHRDVYRLEPGGLSLVTSTRVAGGTRVSLDSAKPDGILLLTDRGAVISKTMHHLRHIRARSLELLAEVIRLELVELDRKLQTTSLDATRRSHLRNEVHKLHGRIAWLFEPQHGRNARVASFRELDHVMGQLERVYLSLEPGFLP